MDDVLNEPFVKLCYCDLGPETVHCHSSGAKVDYSGKSGFRTRNLQWPMLPLEAMSPLIIFDRWFPKANKCLNGAIHRSSKKLYQVHVLNGHGHGADLLPFRKTLAALHPDHQQVADLSKKLTFWGLHSTAFVIITQRPPVQLSAFYFDVGEI